MAFLMKGSINGKVLIYHGYRYDLSRKTTGKYYWRCWKPTSRAPLQTDVFDFDADGQDIQPGQISSHDHPKEDSLISSEDVYGEMRGKVLSGPTKPIKRVYNEIIAQHAEDEEKEELPVFKKFRTRSQRVRASVLQHHLDCFVEALLRRPLRPEKSQTPMQLWIRGQALDPTIELQKDVDLNQYGIDIDGPVTSDYEFEIVEVPEVGTTVPENCLELIANHHSNDIISYVRLYEEY